MCPFIRLHSAVVLTWIVAAGFAFGAPFTPGNLVVVRVGDGGNSIGSTAAAVSLVEYETDGTFVQAIALPSTGTTAFTLRGNDVVEGTLQLTQDGRFLTLAGYRKDLGGTNPSSDTAADTPRVIARVDFNGNVDTTTALTDAFSTDSVRGAASDAGNQFWVAGQNGTSGGLRYVSSLGATTSTGVGSSGNNLHQVSVLGGNLFVSAEGATPGRSVFQVGTGLPTSGDPTLTAAFGPETAGTFHSFYFTNLGSGNDWNGTGFDTVYTVTTNNDTLSKYSFNGSSWVLNNTIMLTGLANVTGTTTGTTVQLFVTTDQTGTNGTLQTLTDTSGFNANNNGSFGALVSGTSSFFAFRGIAFAPTAIPEPGSLLLAGVAAFGLASFWLKGGGWRAFAFHLTRFLHREFDKSPS